MLAVTVLVIPVIGSLSVQDKFPLEQGLETLKALKTVVEAGKMIGWPRKTGAGLNLLLKRGTVKVLLYPQTAVQVVPSLIVQFKNGIRSRAK